MSSPPSRGRRGLGALGAALVVIVAVAAALGVGRAQGPVRTRTAARVHAPARAQTPASRPLAVVRIAPHVAPTRVPRSFLGLSTEYWTIPVWARHLALLGRVLSSISPDGPMVLRIGGSSADQTFWEPSARRPEWVYATSPAWLAQVHQIVARFGVRVILDLNLVTATPQLAARWARAAVAALPPKSIVGFEIGNEADTYRLRLWRQLTGGPIGSRRLPRRLTAGGYARTYRAYARALARVDRGIPLLGPALSDSSDLDWISRLLAGPHHDLGAITVHRYPLSACASRGSPAFPTIARVLGEHATTGMAASIRGAVRIARQAELPVRLTEINSVTCGGRRGVSDTFATALWAPDALFELLRAGARSAAVHVRADAINMAFSLTRHGLVANPLLYGLVAFTRTLGPRARLVPLRVSARRSLRLKAWAVRVGGHQIHVLLINKGTRPAPIALAIPATGDVTTQRLLARSVRASTGVTLGGRHLDARGRWAGAAVTGRVSAAAGGYAITVRGQSATRVTATLR